MWEAHRDDGLMIIHLLTEGNINGSEATSGLQFEWTAQYDIEFPVIREPSNPTYGRFISEDIYPGSLPFLVLLDREMRIDSAYGAGAEDSILSRLETLLDVDEALAELEELDPRQARIVALRFFGGFEVVEVAAALEVSVSTVEREWRAARAWLGKRLAAEGRS